MVPIVAAMILVVLIATAIVVVIWCMKKKHVWCGRYVKVFAWLLLKVRQQVLSTGIRENS